MSIQYYRLRFNPIFSQLAKDCCSKDCEYYSEYIFKDPIKSGLKAIKCSFFKQEKGVLVTCNNIKRFDECLKCLTGDNDTKYIIFETITQKCNDNLCSKDCKYYGDCIYSEKNMEDKSSYIAGCRLDKILSKNIIDGYYD